MELKERCVLSFQNETSDKVYIIESFVSTPNSYLSTGTLIATWGRRKAPRLSSQVKLEGVICQKTTSEFNKLKKLKEKSGYITITEEALKDFDIPGYARKSLRRAGQNVLVNASEAVYGIPRELPKPEEVRTII